MNPQNDFKKYEYRNHAKIEFLSIKDELLPLFDKGLSYKGIYRFFIENKRISMCYDTFRRYAKIHTTKPSPEKIVNSESKTNIKKLKLGVSESSFKHTNLPDQNELAGIGEEN